MTEHPDQDPPAEHRIVASPDEQIAHFTRERRRQATPREIVRPSPRDDDAPEDTRTGRGGGSGGTAAGHGDNGEPSQDDGGRSPGPDEPSPGGERSGDSG